MVWQPYTIYPKTCKNLLQNGLTDQGETSHKCFPNLLGTGLFTNNWWVTWSGSHIGFTLKFIKIFPRMAGQIEGKLHTNVSQALGIPGCSQKINRSHGLAALLDWTKILKKNLSWLTASIDVKRHSYDVIVMENICLKIQPDRTHGLAARII